MKTLLQCAEAFVSSLRKQGQSEYSAYCLMRTMLTFVRWLADTQGIERPAELTTDVITLWHLYLGQRRHRYLGTALKPVSVFGIQKATQHFCQWLAREGHASLSLMRNYPVARRPAMPYKTALRHGQVRKVLRAIPTDTPFDCMMRALMEFFYSTGARPCEALRLQMGAIDFENGLVCLHGKKNKERVVPVGAQALRWLESYQQGIRPLLLRNPAESALWLNRMGEPLRYATFRENWRDLRERVPVLAGVTAYSLRRACATELARGGADLWAVKEQLGHDSLDCLIHYVRPDLADLRRMHAKHHPRDQHMEDETSLPGTA